ncbi:TonB-dependent receptor [Sandarakinorhabdus sp. DWP1-3-1]|uniref:TonB-dependent receptor n=1 Tax=Sandarakinorhabdus sp. DWP1-3-1 TaxID=2804627 RepID=UPI003CEE7A1C
MRSTVKTSYYVATAIATLAVLLPATMAHAQTTANAPPPSSQFGVDEIVVTAQRREQRLQDVPISITAFTSEDLRRTGTQDITRLAQNTPGFTFGRSGLEARPAIRGVRTENVAGNGDPTIGFYVDDIYQSRAAQAGQPFVDVQRVEVLRGPQGTLFGRNVFGGAVSVVGALPGAEFDFGGNVIVGNYSRVAASGYVSIPLSSNFGIRIAGTRETRDGYVKNIVVKDNDLYSQDTKFIRATALWTPTDSLEIIVRGSYWSEGGTGGQAFGYKPQGGFVDPNASQSAFDTRGGRDLNGILVPNLNFFSATSGQRDGIPDFQGRDLGVSVDPDPYTWQGQLRSFADLEQKAVSAQIKWSNDAIFVRSITGYQDFSYVANAGEVAGPTAAESRQIRGSDATSQEFQIGGSETKPLQWIVGLYYLNDKVFDEFGSFRTNINDGIAGSRGPFTAKVESKAVYGQASYYVVPQLRLTGGIRYTEDDKDFDVTNFRIVAGVDVVNNSFKLAGKFKKTTWRAGADFFATPDNMVYASVSTGFRSGGFNGGAGTNPLIPATFAPETVTAYEIGSKNRFADGRYQFNISLYRNDFKDLQVQNQFLVGATTLSAIRNAGEAYSQGLEAELVARPVPELTLNATATLMKTKYTEYITGAPPNYPAAPNGISLAGKEIPFSPRSKFTFAARYDIDLGNAGVLTPSANAIVSSSFFNTDFNTELDRQKAYAKFDARLGWRSKDDRYGVDVFVENIGDVAVKNRGVFGSQGLNASYETPRFYGVQVTFRR